MIWRSDCLAESGSARSFASGARRARSLTARARGYLGLGGAAPGGGWEEGEGRNSPSECPGADARTGRGRPDVPRGRRASPPQAQPCSQSRRSPVPIVRTPAPLTVYGKLPANAVGVEVPEKQDREVELDGAGGPRGARPRWGEGELPRELGLAPRHIESRRHDVLAAQDATGEKGLATRRPGCGEQAQRREERPE